jgi:hypothetical protein
MTESTVEWGQHRSVAEHLDPLADEPAVGLMIERVWHESWLPASAVLETEALSALIAMPVTSTV